MTTSTELNIETLIPGIEALTKDEVKEALFFLEFLFSLIVIEGKKGSGKTLLAMALVMKFKEYFEKKIILDFKPRPAFGDYGFIDESRFIAELTKITDIVRGTPQDQVDLAVEWSLKKLDLNIENKVIVLDESYRYFDCRTPSDKLVRVFGYFIAQMRHYHLTIILLCPSKRYLDRRVRDQIDFLGKVAFNPGTLVAHSRFLSYLTGEIKALKVYGPNYFDLYDSWSPIAIRKRVLDLRGSL